jgi:hypothetical protein
VAKRLCYHQQYRRSENFEKVDKEYFQVKRQHNQQKLGISPLQ